MASALRSPYLTNEDSRLCYAGNAATPLLVDSGPVGTQIGTMLLKHEAAHPSLLPYEVASTLRRLAASNIITPQLAVRSLREVALLRGQAFEFAELASRVWEVRDNISTYDASYIALAELLEVPLLTLHSRLHKAPGTRCQFVKLRATGP